MSHYSSSNLSVTGRSVQRPTNPVPPSPVLPTSPTPFGPSSPSASASPYHTHSHPPSPISRFAGGTINQVIPSMLPAASGNIGGNKNIVIQRPLPSRVNNIVGIGGAVQASHTIGGHHPNKPSSAAARGNTAMPTTPGNLGGGVAIAGSPVSKSMNNKYGTFPRGSSATAGRISQNSSPGLGSDSIQPSPARGMSPNEPLSGSPSTLHPRPRTGNQKMHVRTPPHSNHNSLKKKSGSHTIRRNSDHSVGDVNITELNGELRDMEISTPMDESGYASDGSGISVDSHVSSFPPPDTAYNYSSVYSDGSIVYGAVDVHDDADAELAEVSDEPRFRGGFPASPLQLRAGAPYPLTPKIGAYSTTPAAKSAGSGRNSSARMGGSSAENSALQSPQMDPTATKGVMSPIDGLFEPDKESIMFPPPSHASVIPSPHPQFTTVPALDLPRSAARASATGPSPRSPTTGLNQTADAAAAAAALSMPSPNRQLSDLVNGGGSSSAFSSARSLNHSESQKSLGDSDAMEVDYQSASTTQRSWSGSIGYSQSTSNSNSTTNLHHDLQSVRSIPSARSSASSTQTSHRENYKK